MSDRSRTRTFMIGAAVVTGLLAAAVFSDRTHHERVPPTETADREVSPPATSPAVPAGPRTPRPSRAPLPLPPSPSPSPAVPSTAGHPAQGSELFGTVVSLEEGFVLGEALAANAANADAWLDELCEEAARLRAKPAFREPARGTRDAAAFMEPLIDYEKPLDEPPGHLRLPDDLRARLSQYADDWPTRITDADLTGRDFRWLAELGRFDRWSLLGASRLREFPPDFTREPIPNYMSLLQWSKLRYALGLRRGDVLRASAELLHLADLLRSQGILIAEFVALALVRVDARAREAAVAAGLEVGTWVPTPKDRLDQHRRVSLASIYFAWPGVSSETLRKAADCMPAPCPALLEGVGTHRSFGAFAETDNSDLLRELALKRGCDLSSFDRLFGSPELPAGKALESFGGDLATRIPGILSIEAR